MDNKPDLTSPLFLRSLGLEIDDQPRPVKSSRYVALNVRQISGRQLPCFLKLIGDYRLWSFLEREVFVTILLSELRVPTLRILDYNFHKPNHEFRYVVYERMGDQRPGFIGPNDCLRLPVEYAASVVKALRQLYDLDSDAILSLRATTRNTKWDKNAFSSDTLSWLAARPKDAIHRSDRSDPLETYLRRFMGLPALQHILELRDTLIEQFPVQEGECFIHSDCSPANTFFLNSGAVLFFDWEWCQVISGRYPGYALDVANYFIRAWPNHGFQENLLLKARQTFGDDPYSTLHMRIALFSQLLQKLAQYYRYDEPYWVAKRTLFSFLCQKIKELR